MFFSSKKLLVLGLSLAAASSQAALAGKQKYEVTTSPDGTLRAGPATLVEHQGLKIIHLFGTRVEMARQHAAFSRGKVKTLALDTFVNGIRDMVIYSSSGTERSLSLAFIDYYLYPSLIQNFTPEERELFTAFEQEAGMKEGEMLKAAVYPDLGETLMARLWKSTRLSGPMIPGLGCTSFVLNASKSAEGGLIHGRNLDFHGEGAFERNGAVVYFHPSEPGVQDYASVTTLGVHVAGPTAFNESGIVVDLHQLTVNETSTGGRPVLMLMEQVIRKARNLDQAIQLLKSFKFTTPWKVNLSSSRENRFAVVEVSADHFSYREMTRSGGMVETNHARLEDLKDNEFFPGYRYAEDTTMRQRNAEAALREALPGGVTAQEAVSILGDTRSRVGKTWETRTIQGTPSRMDSVSSVVFVPGRQTAYVAVARMDFGKANEGRFVAVPMSFETDADHTSRSLLAHTQEVLTPEYGPTDDRALAHAHYRRAYTLYASVNDMPKTIKELESATQLEPNEALYPLMLSITYLRAAGLAARNGHSDKVVQRYLNQANSGLKEVLTMRLDPYHVSLTHLLLGEIAIAHSNKHLAREEFGQVDASLSSILEEELKRMHKVLHPAAIFSYLNISKFAELGLNYVDSDVTKF